MTETTIKDNNPQKAEVTLVELTEKEYQDFYLYKKSQEAKEKDLNKVVTMDNIGNDDLFYFETKTYFYVDEGNRKKLLQAVKKENNLNKVTRKDILYFLENDLDVFVNANNSFEEEVNKDIFLDVEEVSGASED